MYVHIYMYIYVWSRRPSSCCRAWKTTLVKAEIERELEERDEGEREGGGERVDRETRE